MTMARKVRTFGTIGYSSTNPEQYVDLDPGIATEKLVCVLEGSITVTGAVGDGVLNDDTLQRLISNIKLERDGFPIIRDIPLRDMYQIFARGVAQLPTQDEVTTAEIQAAGTYPFRLSFEIPFSSGWLIQPYNTHLPPMRVQTALRLTTTWSTAKANSGDDAGTGAIVASGSDTYSWATEPSLKVYQVGSTKINKAGAPRFVRAYSQFVTNSFAAAQSRLELLLSSQRSFDLHLIRSTDNGSLSDLIETLSFEDSRSQYYREVTLNGMREIESSIFPAVNRTTGYLGIRHAAGGLLNNRVIPSEHPNLKYAFATGTPSGTGLITVTSAELLQTEGE